MVEATRSLGVALVGVGGIARNYRAVYTQIPGVTVKAVVDLDAGELAAARSELDAACTSSSLEAALRDDVDVVVINTPNHLHREQAIAAFDAGKHVLIQKPLARTVVEAREIVEAAERTGRVLGMYQSGLENPLWHDVRRLLAEGGLGTLVHAYARLGHRLGLAWNQGADVWRMHRAVTGGGSFIMGAIHYVHLLQWLRSVPIVRVSAITKNVALSRFDAEDHGVALAEFADGVTATFESAWCAPGKEVSLYGTGGMLRYLDEARVEFEADRAPWRGGVLACEQPGERFSLTCAQPRIGDPQNPLNQQRAFLQAVMNGEPPPVDGCSGLRDVAVVEAIYRAASTGCFVDVEAS